MLAKQAATVDAISQGRLIMGLGAGWNRREYDAFGFPYDRRTSPENNFDQFLAFQRASQELERLWLPRSGHLVGVDVEHGKLAEAVVQFLRTHTHREATASPEIRRA